MSRVLALAAVLFPAAPVAADDKEKDWTGKLILLRSGGVSSGKPGISGIEATGPLLTANYVYKVRAEKGEFVELVGFGWISKSDAVTVDDAVTFFTAEIKKRPKDADLYGRRGLAHLSTGQTDFAFGRGSNAPAHIDAALADLDEAIRLAPKDVGWWNFHGWARLQQRDYDKAAEDYTKAIELDPKSTAAYQGRGTAWRAKKEYDKAIEDYTQALKLEPKQPHLLISRGIAWSEKGESDKAIKDYTEAIESAPGLAMAFNNRGNAWRAKKEYDKAIADYTEAIRLDPKYPLAYRNRGLACARKHDYKAALADYSKAVELNPNDATALNGLAWLQATSPDAKVRDGKKAVETAKKALKLSDTSRTRDTLAAAYAETGDFDRAIAEQKKALEDKALSEDDRKTMEARLELYKAKKPYRDE